MSAERVRAAIDEAEVIRAEPPHPLARSPEAPDPFPIDALDGVLKDAILAIHEKVQAPLSMCGNAVLAAATLVVQGRADVLLPTGQLRPLSNFFVTLGETGERKTGVDALALAPIRAHEEYLTREYRRALPAHINAKKAFESETKRLLRSREDDASTWRERQQKLEALGSEPREPLFPMMLCPEPTIEGLHKLLERGQPSMGIFSGEGGQFLGGHGMRREAKLATASGLSTLWDGEPVRRVRSGEPPLLLHGRRVSLHLMAQPIVASEFLADPLVAGQGLLSRVLVTAPPSASGTRFWRKASPEADAALRRYGEELSLILGAPPLLAPGTRNQLAPRPLTFSLEAEALFVTFSNFIESKIGLDGELAPVRGLANKLAEHAARLGAVLQLIEDPDAELISAKCFGAGVELAQHYAAEALRLFGAPSDPPDIVEAKALLAWLDEWDESLISLPDIYQRGPNCIRNRRAARRSVEMLVEHGFLTPVEGGGTIRGVRRREAWCVHRTSGEAA